MKRQDESFNAIVRMNESIELSTKNFHEKSESCYYEISVLTAMQPEKYRKVLDDVLGVRDKSNSIILQIERLKQEIIAKAEGVPYNPDQKISLHEIKNKDDLNVASDHMFKVRGPGKGDSLKVWVDGYREFLLYQVKDTSHVLYHNISYSLATYDFLNYPKGKQSWQERMFVQMPLVGSIAMLNKLQMDIRNAEADVVEYMILAVDENRLRFRDVKVMVETNRAEVSYGADCEAQIYIALRDEINPSRVYFTTKYPYYDSVKTQNDDYYIYNMVGKFGVDYDTLPVIDGVATVVFENMSKGVHEFGGIVQLKTKFGIKNLPFKEEFVVD
jgi:gliding motility-associated protein GldM